MLKHCSIVILNLVSNSKNIIYYNFCNSHYILIYDYSIISIAYYLYRQKYNRTEKIEEINEQNETYFKTFIAILYRIKNTIILMLHNQEIVEEYIERKTLKISSHFKIFKENWNYIQLCMKLKNLCKLLFQFCYK